MATQLTRSHVTVLDVADLPETADGISIYKDVVVCWDPDRDVRILDWLDSLAPWVRAEIVAVHERKGDLTIVWRNAPRESELPRPPWTPFSVDDYVSTTVETPDGMLVIAGMTLGPGPPATVPTTSIPQYSGRCTYIRGTSSTLIG